MHDLIPLTAVFCIFGLPVCAFMLSRILKHRERVEMIRHGVGPIPNQASNGWNVPPPPQAPNQMPNSRDRKNGRDHEIETPYVTLRKGIQLSMIGLALTIGLSFVGYDSGSIHPGPWLLGGLIPMFVGLAQVILALLAGAGFSGSQQWTVGQVPPPQFGTPPGPPPGPQSYDTSYTYRPGDRQELQPPASPPERR